MSGLWELTGIGKKGTTDGLGDGTTCKACLRKQMSGLGEETRLGKKGTADGLGDGMTCKACPRKNQCLILGWGLDL